ncbi:MAG: DUF5991 domain-containing protein [Bacteroidota bacterium]
MTTRLLVLLALAACADRPATVTPPVPDVTEPTSLSATPEAPALASDTTDWAGTYTFAEAEGHLTRTYRLAVFRDNDRWVGSLDVDGYQTMTRLLLRGVGDDGALAFVVARYRMGNATEAPAIGDTAFVFRRGYFDGTPEITTRWVAMEPLLSTTPSVGPLFRRVTVSFEPDPVETTSVYTEIDLDACRRLDDGGDRMIAAWACDGYDQLPIYVTEGDLRFDVDVGTPNDRWTTPSGFNTLGGRLEWRIRDGVAVGAIIRYRIDGIEDVPARSDLAVLSVGSAEGPGCLVAWVPASATPSQNEAARDLADVADTLPCVER